MRSIIVLLVLLFLACAFGQTTFNATISAHWSIPCGSVNSIYSTLPYDDPSACRLNPPEQVASYLSTPVSVTWGVGVYGASYASTLTFDPYDAVTLKLFNGNVASSAVPIGVLTHFNFPINCFEDCNKYIPTNFVLGLSVYVQTGVQSQLAYYKGDFTMFLDETPNVDGRSPLSAPCSYNPHETSWDAFTGNVGYTSDYPCCPYYTAKAVPNGAISLNGPCSDRLKFSSPSNLKEFIVAGTSYTLVIAGFSSSNTVFNSDVTFFTSQENQSQQAYVWAYVSRKCKDSTACNDNKQCTANVCNAATGLCEYPATNEGGTCTDEGYFNDVCTRFKCKSGVCSGSALPNGGSCVNSKPRNAGFSTDCSRSVCAAGLCQWETWRSGQTCTTGPAFTDQQCQKKVCNLGSCRLGSANTNAACTPASAAAQAALAASSTCNSATCIAASSGTCRFTSSFGGSCTQASTAVCNKRVCKSKLVGVLTVGTCLGSAVTGSCQNTGNGAPAAALCKQRRCVSKSGNVGSCQVSNGPDGGSCTTGNGAIAAAECKIRTCSSGVCRYSNNNNQGSCTNAALTLAQCWKRNCNAGTCGLTINTNQGSCTDAALTKKECNRIYCNNGNCVSQPNPNQGSCTGPSPVQCKRRACNAGTCGLTENANQGSCTGPSPVQCKRRACNAGTCGLTENANQGSCTGPSPVECKRRACNAGTCGLTINANQGSCTDAALTKKECRKIVCNTLNGICESQPNSAQGSCSGPGWRECYRRTCTSAGSCRSSISTVVGSCSSLTARFCFRRICSTTTGVCGSAFAPAGGSCSGAGLTAVECKKRVCNGAGACIGSSAYAGGSCSDVLTTRKACYKRACNAGTCNYTPNSAQGSCQVTSSGTPVSWVVCRKRTCSSSGSCAYSFNDLQGSCQITGAGVTVPGVVCKKRACSSGSCVYQNNDAQGSCTVDASGAAVAAVVCKKRTCSSGICTSSNNDAQGSCTVDASGAAVAAVVCKKRTCSSGVCTSSNNDAQGSCTVDGTGGAVSARDCKKRTCSSGACTYSDNTVGGGSCSSSWVGNSQTNVAVVFCNKRNCNTKGTCKYVANTGETLGSCASLPFLECNKRQCKSTTKTPPGSCGYVGVTSGSCTGKVVAECKIRQCQANAVCDYTSIPDGGSCSGIPNTNAGLSASCTRRICTRGSCALSLLNNGGTCNTGKTSNDYTCFKQRCRSKVLVSGASGGTCSTSASPTSRSCNAGGAYSNTECRVARCDGTGSCRYNYNSYGTSVACTSLPNKVCAPERCNGQGTCVYRGDLKEGNTGCLATDSTTVFCTDSKCLSGECVDVSDVNKNASTICKTSGAGEDTCKNYYCLYKNPSSTSNKLGTCVRLKDPSQVNQKCSSSAYSSASTEDARCFNLLCDSNGVCQKQNRADGVYCATPPNTETNNGFGCSQYVCKAGTCNTAAAVPIKNGTACAGWLPCDPSTAGCDAECQRFICYNGVCQVDYFKENQNCTYIKYLTARSEDGTLVEEEIRDSENGGITANECTQGKCYQGRCKAVTVQNGTACGNRTKYNDLCYGDYCNAQGRCVNTGRRNCQGVLPLPSVCWDVTCEASSGDCVLRANGVVDCSCIFDCSACTAKLQSGGRKLSCWWCTGDKNGKAGCFNRKLPGQTGAETPPPQGHGKCYKDNSPCAGDNGLSGGQIAGIVVGILGLTSLALLVIALLILAIRYFAAPAAPPANASLTDLAFDKNVKNNVFYKGANLEMFSSVYAEPKFITT